MVSRDTETMNRMNRMTLQDSSARVERLPQRQDPQTRAHGRFNTRLLQSRVWRLTKSASERMSVRYEGARVRVRVCACVCARV